MAVGFPAKVTFANGQTLSATDLNDLAGTLNLASPVGQPSGKVLTANGSNGLSWGNSTLGTNGVLIAPLENWTVSATAASGIVNLDVKTQGVLYYTTAASANWTLNTRGDSGTTLASVLAVGQAITVVFLATQGATAYYPSNFTIDGNSQTIKWWNGSTPTAGTPSGVDLYSLTIVKTAATPTYSALGSYGRFV